MAQAFRLERVHRVASLLAGYLPRGADRQTLALHPHPNLPPIRGKGLTQGGAAAHRRYAKYAKAGTRFKRGQTPAPNDDHYGKLRYDTMKSPEYA